MIYDFNNAEHFKLLERQAYDGTIDVAGFPPAAYRYFDSLRLLYARYKYDRLSADDAAAIKRKLLRDYNEAKNEYARYLAVYKTYQDNIKLAGELLNTINKERDIYEIAKTACRCIGLLINDSSFAVRLNMKIEEVKT